MKKLSVVSLVLCLAVLSLNAQEPKPLRALLITGGCCHDYNKQKDILKKGIEARAFIEVEIIHSSDTSTKPPLPIYGNADYAKGYDIVIHDECSADINDKTVAEGVLKPHLDGVPAVNLHCAMHSYRTDGWNKAAGSPWMAFTGLNTTGHGPQKPIEITFTDADHPITKGLATWTTGNEELYNNVRIIEGSHELARGKQENNNFVVVWTNEFGPKKTRVFSTTLGHNNATVADARYLDLVTRGLLWATGKLDDKRYHQPAPKKKVMIPLNLALNKTASASASQGGHDPAHAVDGDDSSRWCSPDDKPGQWWQVDLQKAEELTGAKIYWELSGKRYRSKVEGSTDGKTWQMLSDQSQSNSREQEQQLQFNAKGIRYVRITVTGLDAGSWGSFFEAEIHGTQMVESTGPGASLSPSDKTLMREVKAPKIFNATLFAAPPEVNYPACLTVTPTGEVFVGIDQNGSLGHDPKNRMEIVRCLDTDGDGKADKFIPFTKIGSPRGLVYTGDKLFVLHPPKLSVFPINSDGSAGEEKVLISGLGGGYDHSRGADHTTNGIQMGIDGWIYIAVGDFGFTKAIAADGKELQLYGGGIARVRPDGTEFEIVSRGQRNIYDVAISPQLDLFTRDNTNDGGGWDVRLSHVIMTGNYGYPRLFKNFPDEIIQPLADYGGGSPTGSIFLDEPMVPEPFGRGLYTVEWGRNGVMRHPLEPSGAGFKAKQETFVELSRPTDMDVDGAGNLYIASWKDGGFSFSGPNVGYVIRLTATAGKPQPFPDLKKATDAQLLAHLASASHVLRFQTQREILRRGDKPAFASGLEALALAANQPIGARVASMFTLKQLRGVRSHDTLVRLTKDADLREFALRALADRISEVSTVPTKPFVDALADPNPRVRLQAAIGLGRLGKTDAAAALLPLTTDADPLVAHVAIHSLVTLRASDVCLRALDSAQPITGSLRVLQSLHEPPVVDGLIARLGKTSDPTRRQQILKTLCRLYFREADWKGDWWGTRPDTTGPFYKPVAWEETPKIEQALKQTLASANADLSRFLLLEMQRHRIESDETTRQLIAQAEKDPAFRSQAIELLANRSTIPSAAIPLLESVASSAKENVGLRARSFDALQRASRIESLDATVRVLVAFAADTKLPGELSRARENFLRDGRHTQNTNYFATLSESDEPARLEIAFNVLLHTSQQKQIKKPAKDAIARAIEHAWTKPDSTVALLHSIGQTQVKEYADQVRTHLADARPNVQQAASFAAKQLKLDGAVASSSKGTIANLPYDQAVAAALKEKGDTKTGEQLFAKQNCLACHTVSKTEPPKGPYLGDIATRYSRAQLAESILKPSAIISQGFEPQWFEMKDGSEYDGFAVREGGNEIEIRNAAGVAMVLKTADIAKRGKRAVSTMPEGLVATLAPQELASMLAYLESLNKK